MFFAAHDIVRQTKTTSDHHRGAFAIGAGEVEWLFLNWFRSLRVREIFARSEETGRSPFPSSQSIPGRVSNSEW